MKKGIFFVVVVFVFLNVVGQEVKQLETQIKAVKVFLRGAEIERQGKISLQPGVYELVVPSLPTTINPASVFVEGKGNFTILFVEFRENYLNDYLRPKIKALEDSIKSLEKRLAEYNNALAVLGAEESLLLANKVVSGQNTGLNVEVLKSTAEFLRVRLTDIKAKQLDLDGKTTKLNEEIAKLKNQLSSLQASTSKPIGEIAIQVKVNASTTANLTIRYYIPEARWVPLYDIHVKDIGEKATLALKAQVNQATGETWENVQLTLSTANPAQNNTPPVLHPWYLYVYEQTKSYTYPEATRILSRAPSKGIETMAEEAIADESASKAENFVQLQETELHVNYIIDLPYTIEGNGKDKIVDIKTFELNASYQHYAVPKLASNAFLLARLTNWEGLNLLPGSVNIFFQQAFVGKTFVDPASVRDTMEISLGIDKSISIERRMIKDFSSKSLLGNYRKVNKGWEIVVKNNKNKPIAIRVEDQVPLSTSKELTIEVLDYSGATIEEKTGKVTWNLNLQPGENVTKTLKYSVKYPKDKIIYLE